MRIETNSTLIESQSLGELVQNRAAQSRSTSFALFSDDEALTAPELNTLANRIAARMSEDGVTKGSRVILTARPGPTQIASMTACWKLGSIVCTADPFIEVAALDRLIGMFNPLLGLIDPSHQYAEEFIDVFRARKTQTLILTPEDWSDSDFSVGRVNRSDGAVCIYTSGSTGNPKGVLLSHGNLLAGAENVVAANRVGPSDRVLCVLPMSHINGLVTTFVTPLISGGSVLYSQKPFSSTDALRIIDENSCTWFSAVPTHYATLMSPPVESNRWSLTSLRFCRSASAPLPARLLREFEEHYQVPIIETMGMTETAGQIFSNPLPPAERKPGAVGLPIGFDVRLVDEEEHVVEAEYVVGEIQVRGAAVMPNYLDDLEETGRAFSDNWLKSGDLAERDSDGFYRIKGRKKDIAIFAGINISLRALEAEIQERGIVRDVACVGIEHNILGETVEVYAVLNHTETDTSSVAEAMCEIIYPLLPNRTALTGVHFVPELPRSGVGKVLKGLLKEQRQSEDNHLGLPTSSRSLLARALGVSEDQINDDLRQSSVDNWDSLAQVALVAGVESILDIQLTPHQMNSLTSYKGLTAVMDGTLPDEYSTHSALDAGIEVRAIRVKDLHKFATEFIDNSRAGDVIPISPHRALAQSKNRYADDDDIGLIVALKDGRCIGYRGLMPGMLKTRSGMSKIYWLSTWYVPVEYRSSGIGIRLLNEAMSLGYDLVSAGMSAQAQEVYRGVHFRELGPLEYYIIDGFKLNALAWPFRLMRKIAKKVGIGFEVADSLVRVADRVFAPLQQFLYPRILHRAASRFHDFTYQEVDQVRIEQANRDGSDGIRFHRGPEVINWMLANKWLLETGQADRATTGLKYNFSNTRDLFRYIPVEIFSSDGSEYKGYVVFSPTRVNSVTNIRVLDIDVSNEKDLGAILCLASEYAKRYRADRISAPASVVEQLGGSRLSKLIFRKTIKRYLHRPASDTSPMALYAEEIQLDYCDGDIAFT